MIEVRDVTYRYPGQARPALDRVSARVELGEVVGIVGPNGSGKSTLGRLMKGLLLPDSGSVGVDGQTTERDGLEVRRLVGLVFQNPNSQIVNAVVDGEVAFGPENLGLEPAEIRERVREALAAVGLDGHESDESHSLSMAEKQRVALASVLAMRPRYLVLDEATTWLEPRARWPLLEQVLRWGTERNAGVVLITHRMDEAQICQRLYGMLHGMVEVVGTPDEVLQNEEVRRRLALDVPEAFVLTSRLQASGLPVKPGAPLTQVAEDLCRS